MTNESPDRAKVIALPPLILLGMLCAGFVLQFAWPLALSPVLARALALTLGLALIVFSVGLAVWAARTFSTARTPLDVRKPVNGIVTTGPFRFSRNPVYLGMVLLTIGIGFVADSLWIVGSGILLAVVLQRGVIEPEEAYLAEKFGAEYLGYKSGVRRWI